MISMNQLISVKERHGEYLLRKANVTGLGIGFKKVNGKMTNHRERTGFGEFTYIESSVP